MTQSFDPKGAWTALVTPFTAAGEFDSHSYARLLDFQLEQGISGLVPCGTTGESPTLTWEEQGAAVALAVRRADGKAGVLAGAGSNNTYEAINGARDAWSRGADAVLLIDCYYNGPSSLELRTEYYERILAAVPEVPVVPYVIPGRTGCALAAEDLALLHQQQPGRVPAIKSATGDLERMRSERSLAGPELAIISGDDDLTLTMMQDPQIGAAGVISVMSNIAPRAVAELCETALKAPERAATLAKALHPLFACLGIAVAGQRQLPDGRTVTTTDKFRNPVPIKTMMAGLGMLTSHMRQPLGLMTAPAVAQCRQALGQVHEQAPEILTPIERAFDISIAARLADDQVWNALARR